MISLSQSRGMISVLGQMFRCIYMREEKDDRKLVILKTLKKKHCLAVHYKYNTS